jgi:hypothetical protein
MVAGLMAAAVGLMMAGLKAAALVAAAGLLLLALVLPRGLDSVCPVAEIALLMQLSLLEHRRPDA